MLTRSSFLATLLVCVSLSSHGTEVYISIDDQGNRVFSDQPSEKARKHTVKDLSTIPALKIDKKTTESSHSEPDIAYKSLIITSPNPGTTLTREKLGSFNISAALSPALQPSDEAVLLVNGKEMSSNRSLNWQLTNMNRGEHSLQVIVREQTSKKRKKTSQAIPIYIKR